MTKPADLETDVAADVPSTVGDFNPIRDPIGVIPTDRVPPTMREGAELSMLSHHHDGPPVDISKSVEAIRLWQRHHLLREYGENGQVLPENLELSEHLDRVLALVPQGYMTSEEIAALLERY